MQLLKYDFFYLRKTHKFIIFPIVAIVFAILSPITARYMNEIILALTAGEGIGIQLPDPTVIDSYVQYISNLFEIFLLVVIFVSVSVFIRDKTKGYLPLIISKPIDRIKYLLSKYFTLNILLFVSLLISGLIFTFYTNIVFGEVDIMVVFGISMLFMLYTLFITGLSLLLSTLLNSYAAASILTFVGYIFFNILGGFDSGILNILPGRLTNRMTEVMVDMVDTSDMVWTIVVTIILLVLLLVGSSIRFRKFDI